ncbi:hypothetical protein PPYR_14890 [Photinus pyralis]|uniref:C2H2-type domain-containing protein n=1 Tax=Photinus pyralis TaxID=7054 RepID=A0A5N4A005_PHOPY|nr:hypothetical protein PPYR_14890 [Photinus pyralis]
MLCFLCKRQFNTLKILIQHFKRVHDLGSSSLFTCCECERTYQYLDRFKKHVNQKHIRNAIKLVDSESTSSTTNPTSPSPPKTPTPKPPEPLLTTPTEPIPSPPPPSQYPVDFKFENIKNGLTQSLLLFILELHNKSNFSRKDISYVQNAMTKHVVTAFVQLFKELHSYLKRSNNTELCEEILGIISALRNPFESYNSEHLLHRLLKYNDYVGDIKHYTLCNEVVAIHRQGGLTYDEKKLSGVLMPLQFQFRKFFERGNLLRNMQDYMNRLKTCTKMKNFIQGKLWAEKTKLYPNKILIPYFVYIDDFEINNPLGSRAGLHSVCNVYYSFPCHPIENSKSENVFLAASLKCKDIKSLGNDVCFKHLINELKLLEETGILIEVEGKSEEVHFVIALVTGDNLGLNSFLNFNKSFSSTSFCRLCKTNKIECHKQVIENSASMRTIENYEDDLDLNNPALTGIRSECILNEIPSFHVVSNYYADVMHDVFEGICHYNFCHALLYFIQQMKYFDISTFNLRKTHFEYGPTEIENIHNAVIELKHIQKMKLKMSARQMMTFTLYFLIMMEDLVPNDDPVWNFLVNFVEIVDILLCFEIDDTTINLLEHKIKKHNSDFVILFNDTLKPKFHNLVHYPTIIRQSGPLRNFWCFKYESFHRQFKIYSNCITSRRNICLSLCKKYEYRFAYNISKSDNNTLFTVNNLHQTECNYATLIRNKLNINMDCLKFFDEMIYKGVRYSCKGYFVSTFENDIAFYVILKIIVINNESVRLFCQKLRDVEFKEHFIGYLVDTTNLGSISILSMNDIVGPPITVIKSPRGQTILRPKEFFRSI